MRFFSKTIDFFRESCILCITTTNTKPFEWKKGVTKMDKKKVIAYTLLTLGIAWAIEIVASLVKVYNPGSLGAVVFPAGLAACMFVPLIVTIILKTGVKKIGWKPKLKGNVRWIFFAVLMPMVFTILGFLAFFMIRPDLFKLDGSYLLIEVKDQGLDPVEYKKALDQSGLSMEMMALISTIQCITYAPFINMFLAIGEEAGWRGFLYPELKKRFSRPLTWVIGGIIWAAFHFPAMLIAGYEYGSDYIGAPILGLVTFTLTCIIWGMFCEIIYDKTKCIWFPALFHGGINASATMYRMVLDGAKADEISKLMVFGPAPHGLISFIPTLIIAVVVAVIVLKEDKKKNIAALSR